MNSTYTKTKYRLICPGPLYLIRLGQTKIVGPISDRLHRKLRIRDYAYWGLGWVGKKFPTIAMGMLYLSRRMVKEKQHGMGWGSQLGRLFRSEHEESIAF